MQRFVRPLTVFAAVLATLSAACGRAPVEPIGSEQPMEVVSPADGPMGMYLPDAVSGDIVAAGSSTVFPLSERMAQRFSEEGFTGRITVDSIGSGAGFERFCVAGETDISNASRAIKDGEVESCRAIGREPIAFQVGIDALVVVVNADNSFATGVTLEELARLFSTAQNWSDVRSEWPDKPILRFSPGTDSGTFDYFVEAVMTPANGDDGDAGEAAILNAVNIQLSEDDNVLARGVLGSPYAIGYFGYAYYAENQGALRALPIEGILPTEENAETGAYPIARPLFIYSDATILQAKPQVAAFVYFYLTNVEDEILDVGYFPTGPQRIDQNLDAWKAATGM